MADLFPGYPVGIQYHEVINHEADLRNKAEIEMDKRMTLVEEQLLVIRHEQEMGKLYPDLKEAYNKYQIELEKIKVFEVLKR